MKKKMFLSFPVFGIILIFIISCGPALHQTRLKMLPNPGQTQLTAKDYKEMFDYAMATGLELGYRPVFSSKERGILSFTKEVGADKVPVNINVQIQKQDKETAYVNITMQSPRALTDLTLQEFQKAYLKKWF